MHPPFRTLVGIDSDKIASRFAGSGGHFSLELGRSNESVEMRVDVNANDRVDVWPADYVELSSFLCWTLALLGCVSQQHASIAEV